MNRGDLQRNYSWTVDGGDNARVTGFPDDVLLDRTEGYEVLYFIRKFMQKNGMSNVSSGQKIERLIHLCPKNLRSRANIYNWIVANW